MGRIVDEIAPVAMLDRPAARENRWDARRAEAEDGFELAAIRRDGEGEGIILDDFPAARIDKNEQRQDGFQGKVALVCRDKGRDGSEPLDHRLGQDGPCGLDPSDFEKLVHLC